MSEDMEEFVKLQDPVMDDIKIKHSYAKYIVCFSILSLILVSSIIVYCFVLPEEEQGVNGMNKNERVEKKIEENDNASRNDENNEQNLMNEDKWEESYRKANEFISKLSRTERVNLLFGTQNMKNLNAKRGKADFDHHCVGEIDAFQNDEVKLNTICLQDGPSGIRFANGTSISWQSNINLASTFNKALMYEVGKSLGEEARAKGVNVLLSPSVNMMRTPQSGRVWEAFGDDPYHTGVCASEVIKGIQDAGVIATIKHFVGNDQETYRHASSSNIELGPLMDIYVEPFYRAIHDANVGSIMVGYNAVNNVYCSENKFLITDILKKSFNFKGFIMSDWWGIYSGHTDNFNSGLDMNMPGGIAAGKYSGRDKSYWSNLETLADEKKIPEERITESATRIIATLYQMNQMENYPKIHIYENTITDERIKLQRKAATESQILLKNEDNILPLKNNIKTIGVIGDASMPRDCPVDEEYLTCKNSTNEVINGHIPLGYGSGTTTFKYLVSPLQGITELAEERGIQVKTSGRLCYADTYNNEIPIHRDATEDVSYGVNLALTVDGAIVFVKANSGEELDVVEKSKGDRLDLDVWHSGNMLVDIIAQVNPNVIVVVNAPAVVNLPWLDKVKGVIFSGFAGAESGHAIADVLFGVVNPSGHLPYVWGNLDDYCTKLEKLADHTIQQNGKTYEEEYRYPGIDSAGLIDDRPGYEKEQYDYTEGLYIGQRWFNDKNIKPIFPFGHGLTYTSFEYTDLGLTMTKDGLIVELNVKNIGPVSGSAVPMVFLTFPDSIGDYPKYIFKGFEKVELNPEETQKVSITVDDHALSYFNVEQNKYVRVNDGMIKVYVAENGNPDESKLQGEIDSKF